MRIRVVAEAALAAALAVSGAALTFMGVRPAPGPPPPAPQVVPDAVTSPVEPPVRASRKAAAPPTILDIPAIGVRTPLLRLGLQSDGTVALPPLGAGSPAGWYRLGAIPGEPGAAVILGHVDSARDGPAVFYRLRELRPGALIRVGRADGSAATFAVTRTARYRKRDFPTEAVYGPVDRPELRLVTCGGSYDRWRRTYRENLVVYAELRSRSERP
ncbi:class F sortase [Nucisporomicrobium flavum]|uniref:class F sortase n=1 Tax=Nucisporomicrobium flavum TaxID=2785915 RepID=UPI0027DB9A0E|nr:class F sortase [Nucisporomicrobium flavum]